MRKGAWDMFIWEGNLSGLGAYFLIYLVVQENLSHQHPSAPICTKVVTSPQSLR